MPAPLEWPTRPVFISCTFKAMHAERDWLRNHVFLPLEEELRKRHHHLETVDLRLGVETVEEASEEARELKVLAPATARLSSALRSGRSGGRALR